MRVDQKPNGVGTENQAPPQAGDSKPPDAKPWSPWSTPIARWSWGLMAIFTIIYFVVAVLTSAEFAELAATMIFGLPLGFYLGIGLIISGLIITRIYLSKVEG